jgi:hypothetical protein
MTMGASTPMPAATALASLIAAVALGPWWSARAALTPQTTIVPNVDAHIAATSVAGSGRNAHSIATEPATPANDSHTTPPRPRRPASHGNADAPMSPPTARPVLCRLATAAVVPCSSRSSGTTGPKPYRK